MAEGTTSLPTDANGTPAGGIFDGTHFWHPRSADYAALNIPSASRSATTTFGPFNMHNMRGILLILGLSAGSGASLATVLLSGIGGVYFCAPFSAITGLGFFGQVWHPDVTPVDSPAGSQIGQQRQAFLAGDVTLDIIHTNANPITYFGTAYYLP